MCEQKSLLSLFILVFKPFTESVLIKKKSSFLTELWQFLLRQVLNIRHKCLALCEKLVLLAQHETNIKDTSFNTWKLSSLQYVNNFFFSLYSAIART